MIEALWAARGAKLSKWDEDFGMRFSTDRVPEDRESLDFLAMLYDYYLRCCRAIWELLPQQGSRWGVEVAERFLAGEASVGDVHAADYDCEGAAFLLDYASRPAVVRALVERTKSIPSDRLRAMLHPPESADEIETRELLKRAAYFADFAVMSPWITPCGPPPRLYAPFLSPALLREVFDDPFGV